MNPTIGQFKKKIAERTVTAADRRAFERWLSGTKPTDEERAAGQSLLQEADALGTQANAGLVRASAIQAAAAKAGPSPTGFKGGSRGSQPASIRSRAAAPPALLGEPFHNPYTFIPFAEPAMQRQDPTFLTADEVDAERFTGLIRVTVRALSPILSVEPGKKPASRGQAGLPLCQALRVGGSPIVPASGIRGALRNLLVVLTGGMLSSTSEDVWLCQGRDLTLTRGKSNVNAPRNQFLARVIEAGSPTRDGVVELNALSGRQVLEQWDVLRRAFRREPDRPRQGDGGNRGVHDDPRVPGQLLKLSGRPIQFDGKREGVFEPSGTRVRLPAQLWRDYAGRHRHADFPELQSGDLVWLQPRDVEAAELKDGHDVKSIQWARWGRTGENALRLLKSQCPWLVPGVDRLVDEATDLFGLVATEHGDDFAFSGRVRPDNLVFSGPGGQLPKTEEVVLAVLSQPHPGCLAFYRDIKSSEDADLVCQQSPLRGYKVYRTTTERGATAPWHYSTQGVYDNQGALEQPTEKRTRRCELISEGATGQVTLAVRSLSKRELGLLLAACSVDWRLGGGKPLGLGHCRPTSVELIDEFGETTLGWECSDVANAGKLDRAAHATLPPGCGVADDSVFLQRLAFYQATQRPVPKLRYPRLATRTPEQSGVTRGGHAWFSRLATPKKSDDLPPQGLQLLRVEGSLREEASRTSAAASDAIQAQFLPPFDQSDPLSDVLYGHDVELVQEVKKGPWDSKGRFKEPPPAQAPPRASTQSQNRDTRQHRKSDR